jgi:hypothetical protein
MRAIRAVCLTNATLGDILPDLLRLMAFAAVLPALGYLAFHYAERRARQTGTLGQY